MKSFIGQQYKAFKLFDPAARTANANGTAVNVGVHGDDALAIVSMGAITGTTPTGDIVIEASETSGGTYTTVATISQVTTQANGIAAVGFQLTGSKRFVRARLTVGGTSPSFTFSVLLLVRSLNPKAATNSATVA